MANPCSTCRPFRECLGFSWYHPGDIRYCRQQCIWIINEFLFYRGGYITMSRDTWVVGTDGSGYTDGAFTQQNLSHLAPFELVVQIVGELEIRIEATGKDGQLLVLEVQQGGYLSVDANNALNFISGKRKHMLYTDWLKKRRWRDKLSTKTYPFVKERPVIYAQDLTKLAKESKIGVRVQEVCNKAPEKSGVFLLPQRSCEVRNCHS